MQNKYLSVIVFTVIFAISVAATVGAAIIEKNSSDADAPYEESSSIQTPIGNNSDSREETTNSNSSNANNSYGENNYQNILNQILNKDNNKETVFGNSNVGGKNPHETDVKFEFDGETVTMVFETETTTSEEETTVSPDTAAKDPDPKPVTTVAVTTATTTAPPPVTTVADTTTVSPETTVESTTADDSTTIDEETTLSPAGDNESSTEPIDNSQAEVEE